MPVPKALQAGAGAGAGLRNASSVIQGLAEDAEPLAVTRDEGSVVETEAQVCGKGTHLEHRKQRLVKQSM